MADHVYKFVRYPTTGPFEVIEVWKWNKRDGYGYLARTFVKPGGYFWRRRFHQVRAGTRHK